ncbi:MAG TPA: trypsin-like peptidase domain-containing protein [Terriglobia bacterium]|nr:trypsin-like peptidase domain-containing protein [Terriglobia bacterium]
MTSKRLLYLTLVVATLSVGVMIGAIVTGGVNATTEQKAAQLQIPPLPDPSTLSNAFSQIADQVGPAVVTIRTEAVVPVTTRTGRGGRGQAAPLPDLNELFGFPPANPDSTESQKSLGTGFIVDKAGYILTNHHVIEPPENGTVKKITVVLEDKAEYTAKVMGSDEETDLAVIKIDVGHDLPIARFGNSDSVRIGDWVLAIGSPFQFDHTVTAGIISAKGRDSASGPQMGSQFQSFLQTDAAINPGNSGGPLVNMRGEVIGINTAIVSQTRSFAGLGFALPSNSAVNVYNQLTETGKVTRGYLGISYATEQEKMLRAYGLNPDSGVIVSEVVPGQAASKAGLKPYDIITQIGSTKITSTGVLLEVIANSPVGSSIQVRVLRDGKEVTLPVVVGDREAYKPIANVTPEPTPPAPPANNGGRGSGNQGRGGRGRGGAPANGRGAAPVPVVPNSLGLTVQSIDNSLIQRYGLEGDTAGVIVTGVQTGSVAEDAGFTPGWVVTRVITGGQTTMIRTTEDFARVERSLRSGSEVVLGVLARTSANGPYSNRMVAMTMP